MNVLVIPNTSEFHFAKNSINTISSHEKLPPDSPPVMDREDTTKKNIVLVFLKICLQVWRTQPIGRSPRQRKSLYLPDSTFLIKGATLCFPYFSFITYKNLLFSSNHTLSVRLLLMLLLQFFYRL